MHKVPFYQYKNPIQNDSANKLDEQLSIIYTVLPDNSVNILSSKVNDIQKITLIIAINIKENGAIIKKQIETLIDENEDLFFILSNLYNNYIGNSIQTVDKVNHGRLNTEKPQEFIIEKKYKNYSNINSLLINTITDNLVLNLNNFKYLEDTKNILHIDCDGIQKRKQKHLNYILTSKSIVNKKINRSFIFSIITMWNQSKIFLNDSKIILCTNNLGIYVFRPTNSLDFLQFLKLQSIIMKKDMFQALKKNKHVFF